jgi:hypothetical protein
MSLLVFAASLAAPQTVGPDGLTMAELDQALASLKAAVTADEPGHVARLLQFPLRVSNRGENVTLISSRQFETDYRQIFTAQVKDAIVSQDSTKMVRNADGAAVGKGEVRLHAVCVDRACTARRALGNVCSTHIQQ